MSSDSPITLTLHKSITAMDSDDTMDDSSQNLMHQTNDEILIGESSIVTQHYSDLENSNVGDDEEYLDAPHCPIFSINVAKNKFVFDRVKMYSKVKVSA